MLRLNIRCLNNQARFDPAKEKEREKERKKGGQRRRRTLCRGSPFRARPPSEEEREGDSGSDRVGMERVPRRSSFSILDPRSAPDPLPPAPPFERSSSSLPYTSSAPLLRLLHLLHLPHLLLLFASSAVPSLASSLATLTVSVYTYYAKRVTVGGLGSRTRAV